MRVYMPLLVLKIFTRRGSRGQTKAPMKPGTAWRQKRGRVIFSDADWGTGHKHGMADNTFLNFVDLGAFAWSIISDIWNSTIYYHLLVQILHNSVFRLFRAGVSGNIIIGDSDSPSLGADEWWISARLITESSLIQA